MSVLPPGHATGLNPALRGLRRVTIAARMDDDDYDWLARFYAEYLPDRGEAEPKSERMLRVIDANARAHDQLLANVSRATIIIIDLAEFVREYVQDIAERAGVDLRPFPDPIDALTHRESSPILREVATAILSRAREDAIDLTMLGRIERVAMDAARTFLPMQRSGVLDRRVLREMGDAQFRALAARFAAVMGDALRPESIERIVEERLREGRYVPPYKYIAMESVAVQLERDHFFDEGAHEAFTELEKSRRRLEMLLRAGALQEYRQPTRSGTVTEDDSRRLLGLQAADIAAAIARRIFESTGGDTRGRARAVKRVFDHVLLNDRWL